MPHSTRHNRSCLPRTGALGAPLLLCARSGSQPVWYHRSYHDRPSRCPAQPLRMTRAPSDGALVQSGRQDLNLRPPGPQPEDNQAISVPCVPLSPPSPPRDVSGQFGRIGRYHGGTAWPEDGRTASCRPPTPGVTRFSAGPRVSRGGQCAATARRRLHRAQATARSVASEHQRAERAARTLVRSWPAWLPS